MVYFFKGISQLFHGKRESRQTDSLSLKLLLCLGIENNQQSLKVS